MLKRSVALALALSSTAVGAQVHHRPAAHPTTSHTATAAPIAPARLFDFMGVKLETSIDDFRALPHPDGVAAKVYCTGEKVTRYGNASEPYELSVYNDVEKALGVVECAWFNEGGTGDMAKYMNGNEAGLNIAASHYAANDYTFSFIRDPKDGVMRMFKFSAITNVDAFDDALSALTDKFGKPVITSGTTQNKLGATFPQTTALWANPASTLFMQSRYTKIDDMGFLMTDERLSKIVEDAKKAKKAATPNAI